MGSGDLDQTRKIDTANDCGSLQFGCFFDGSIPHPSCSLFQAAAETAPFNEPVKQAA
jgi:hypothetical protein